MKLAWRFCLCFLLINAGVHSIQAADKNSAEIKWQSWSPKLFEQAKREHRFVLLDLEAVWCHWCHVMDQNTYANPKVIALLNSKYIAVRVDQDARPDLSNRYEEYGWPATVVFNADGGEIVKRQGYLPPAEMIAMLKAIIVDPSPGPSVQASAKIVFSEKSGLTSELRAHLEHKLEAGYDTRLAGWGRDQKFLNWDNVEYCMIRAGDKKSPYEKMARRTLAAQRQLIDPVWGGVDQYSTDGDWGHPHFEKIMQFQAGNLRIYSLAYALWHDPTYLESARLIDHYLETFLTSPEGAFYTSQDADLAPGEHSADYYRLDDDARRRLGVPRIDKHIYARENGWAIGALTTFYCVTGDSNQLNRAVRAADWIVVHRSLTNGGFRHDEHDAAGPYLGDSLAMARAFLDLYGATSDRQWLDRTDATVGFITQNFTAQPGFITAAANPQSTFAPQPEYSENVAMARLANLLFYYTGKEEYRTAARNAMRWIAAPQIADKRFSDVGGVLLADRELNTEPAHLTVVGGKDNAAAKSLWLTALKYPEAYRRIEWSDPRRGPLPNPDVPFPSLPYPAAFVCAKGACSAPLKTPAALQKRMARMTE